MSNITACYETSQLLHPFTQNYSSFSFARTFINSPLSRVRA